MGIDREKFNEVGETERDAFSDKIRRIIDSSPESFAYQELTDVLRKPTSDGKRITLMAPKIAEMDTEYSATILHKKHTVGKFDIEEIETFRTVPEEEQDSDYPERTMTLYQSARVYGQNGELVPDELDRILNGSGELITREQLPEVAEQVTERLIKEAELMDDSVTPDDFRRIMDILDELDS